MPGLLYGPDPGFQPLRERIAAWLEGFYGDGKGSSSELKSEGEIEGGSESGNGKRSKGEAEQICITGGASQNLANILLVYSDPAVTKVWIVAPCYYMACNMFDDAGLEMRAVGEGKEGVDLEALERGFRDCEREGRKKVCGLEFLWDYQLGWREGGLGHVG